MRSDFLHPRIVKEYYVVSWSKPNPHSPIVASLRIGEALTLTAAKRMAQQHATALARFNISELNPLPPAPTLPKFLIER
jgi:hypothetical protein